MSTHNIGFYQEISEIVSKLSSNTYLICSSDFDDDVPVSIVTPFSHYKSMKILRQLTL